MNQTVNGLNSRFWTSALCVDQKRERQREKGVLEYIMKLAVSQFTL